MYIKREQQKMSLLWPSSVLRCVETAEPKLRALITGNFSCISTSWAGTSPPGHRVGAHSRLSTRESHSYEQVARIMPDMAAPAAAQRCSLYS